MTSQLPSLVRRGSSALVLSVLAVAAAGTVNGGCSKLEVPEIPSLDGGNDGNGNGNGNGNNGPLPDHVSIRGFIKNNQGAPVAAAEVTIGDQMSAASDNNGLFDVEAEPNPEDVVIRVSAPDHAPQIVKVPIKSGVDNYGVPVVLQRIQNIAIGPDDLQADVLIDGSDATVIFDEPMGQSATLRFVSPPTGDGPGELRFIGEDGEEALQTAGILWFEIVDEDGNLVGMPGGVIDIPGGIMGLGDLDGAGPLQGFLMDEEEGNWGDPEDPAITMPPSFVLPPSGYFNPARTYTVGCVRGTIASTDAGASCSGGMVTSAGPKGISSKDSIGADGSFCVEGAVGTSTTLHIGSYSANAAISPEAGSCSDLPSCNNVGEIEVSTNQCQLPDMIDPPSYAVGEACTATAQCGMGGECFNGYCVGTGSMRVSLAFDLASDLDLHMIVPGGEEIYWNNKVAGGGQLDLDQCANGGCTAVPHAENIVFAEVPPVGTYEVWVVNYEGAGGAFQIEVSGEVEQTFASTVGMGNGLDVMSESEHFTFTVGAAADAGTADGG